MVFCDRDRIITGGRMILYIYTLVEGGVEVEGDAPPGRTPGGRKRSGQVK